MGRGYITRPDLDQVELIPYYTEEKTIELYDLSGNKIKTIDVSQFALCNQNRKGDKREDADICPEDCKQGEVGPVIKLLQGKQITQEEENEFYFPSNPVIRDGLVA